MPLEDRLPRRPRKGRRTTPRPPKSPLRKDVILVHIPKTGGTSLADSFALTDTHERAVDRAKRSYWGGARVKFAVVRNPWDHARSCWYYFGNYKRELTFPEWLRERYRVENPRKLPFDVPDQERFILGRRGEFLVDALVPFEDLEGVWGYLKEALGPPTHPLGHRHESKVPNRLHYRDLFSQDRDLIRMVRERNSRIVALMGYEYDRPYEGPVWVLTPSPEPR